MGSLMHKKHRKWKEEDVEFIRNNYTAMSDGVIAITLSKITGSNISAAMVRQQRRRLKLEKPKGRPSK